MENRGHGFYYCWHADLSISVQELTRIKQQQGKTTGVPENIMRRKDYIWNFRLLEDFMMQGISQRWFVPIIQGYVSSDHSKTFMSK